MCEIIMIAWAVALVFIGIGNIAGDILEDK